MGGGGGCHFVNNLYICISLEFNFGVLKVCSAQAQVSRSSINTKCYSNVPVHANSPFNLFACVLLLTQFIVRQ